MGVLLDTHAVIWFLLGDETLSDRAKETILDPAHEKYVSVASIWELSIKTGLGRFSFDGGMEAFLKLIDQNGFELLPISPEHAIAVASLAHHHRDPFDRIIVSQCQCEGLTLITKDDVLHRYGVETVW